VVFFGLWLLVFSLWQNWGLLIKIDNGELIMLTSTILIIPIPKRPTAKDQTKDIPSVYSVFSAIYAAL
jgi:hypothetical protein